MQIPMRLFRFQRPASRVSILSVIAFLALFVTSEIAQAQEPDVIIIGAGLAGLSTAYRLNKEGKSFLILEQTPHIGGRIRTAAYPEQVAAEVNTVELSRHSGMDRRNPDCMDAPNPSHPWSLGSGAPCRNDEKNLNSTALAAEVGLEEFWADNPSLEIFNELKIPMEKSATAFSSFLYQGKLMAFTQETNREFLSSLLSKEEMAHFDKWDRKMAELYKQLYSQPIDSDLMKLKEVSFADWVRKTGGLSKKAQEFIRIESEPEYGTSWESISALEGIADWHIFSGKGTGSFHIVGGNQQAALAIAENLGKDRILLNQQVTNIQSLPQGVVVTATDTADFKQHVYHAKYVVTTMPLFRLYEIQFDPPLSAERNQAINTQTWGSYFTAHVILDAKASRFWTVNGESVLPILSDGPLGVIYGGNQEADPSGTLPKSTLLNLLITGDHAERFNARTGDMDAIRATLLEEFDKLWPGFRQEVKKIVFYRYHPRAIASWPVGRSRFDELSDSMRKPQGRVYFAGDFTEGTHSDGAAVSAIRVVQDILKREKNTSVENHEQK